MNWRIITTCLSLTRCYDLILPCKVPIVCHMRVVCRSCWMSKMCHGVVQLIKFLSPFVMGAYAKVATKKNWMMENWIKSRWLWEKKEKWLCILGQLHSYCLEKGLHIWIDASNNRYYGVDQYWTYYFRGPLYESSLVHIILEDLSVSLPLYIGDGFFFSWCWLFLKTYPNYPIALKMF